VPPRVEPSDLCIYGTRGPSWSGSSGPEVRSLPVVAACHLRAEDGGVARRSGTEEQGLGYGAGGGRACGRAERGGGCAGEAEQATEEAETGVARRTPPPPPENALELWPCCKMQHML
jgi:hypothetical protein